MYCFGVVINPYHAIYAVTDKPRSTAELIMVCRDNSVVHVGVLCLSLQYRYKSLSKHITTYMILKEHKIRKNMVYFFFEYLFI